MIDQNRLGSLLSDLESDRVERTISTADTAKFSQAVCAFANDMANSNQPGYLILGVHDDGSRCGLTVTDQLLQNLGSLRSEGNIQPIPAITVQKFGFTDGDVAIVEVLPSDLPPVRYKGQVWIRVGPRKAIASEHEERLLSERRISTAKSFDALPCTEANIDALNLPIFAAYRERVIDPSIIAENHRSHAEQLASLRLFDLRRHCPTYAGILLFGKKPKYFLPGAYVQYCRWSGSAPDAQPIDQAEIHGDLLTVLRELEVRINAGITVGLRNVTAFQEELTPAYPVQAIRELVFNAIVHRDYQAMAPVRLYCFDDHIDIWNPGGLHGGVTVQTMSMAGSYRNPVIAEAMKALGYINRYGYGIQLAQRMLERNGNPPPVFTADPGWFRVVITRRSDAAQHP